MPVLTRKSVTVSLVMLMPSDRVVCSLKHGKQQGFERRLTEQAVLGVESEIMSQLPASPIGCSTNLMS